MLQIRRLHLELSSLALLFLAGNVSSISDSSSRISGGATIVTSGQYPFIVSVSLNNAHICGGFIYNTRFVVTAASCVYGKSPTQIQVTVGQLSLTIPDTGEQRLQITSINIHENYNHTTRFNDIAMLETSQVILFSANANFTLYNQPDYSNNALVLGWGARDESKLISLNLRRSTPFRPPPPNACGAFPSDLYDPNIMFCWGNPVSYVDAPCQYDEGSPFYQQTGPNTGFVNGIVSKNLGCGDSEIFQTIYTKLTAYYAWMVRVGGLQPTLS